MFWEIYNNKKRIIALSFADLAHIELKGNHKSVKQSCSGLCFFYYFLKKTRSGISCELSARQTIQIHCQFLFFLTNTTKCRRQKLWLALKRSYVTRYRLYWLDKWRNKRYIYIVPSKWSGWVANIRHFLENGSGVLFFSFKNSKFTWTNTFTLEFVRWTLSTFYLYTSIVENRYVN